MFFSKWDLLSLPAFDGDTLYEFSRGPEEAHAAAVNAIERWKLPPKPEPADSEPRLSSFTDFILA